jgi:hypothetical protein
MTRWLVRICVFVILGAIVNVAVAWACAWWVLPQYVEVQRLPPSTFWNRAERLAGAERSQLVGVWRGFGVKNHVLFPMDWNKYSENVTEPNLALVLDSMLRATPVNDAGMHGVLAREWGGVSWGTGNSTPAMRVSAGWPSPCLRGWGPAAAWFRPSLGAPLIATTRQGEQAIVRVRTLDSRDIVHLLPWSPIRPGFAINTVFYAGLLWLLFAAPFALRRRLRIKRGLCPTCAYDLRGSVRGSQQCPECGAMK